VTETEPTNGRLVHVGPTCLVAVVLDNRPGEVYVRVFLPAYFNTGQLQWGGIMAVQTHDQEGWVSFDGTTTQGVRWHWPEHGT
jgi:hypothetical protein